jgi:hypothetical protein
MVPEFSNMRKFRKFVNYWLSHLGIIKNPLSRQTLHHWFSNYEKYLDKVITFEETCRFWRKNYSELIDSLPEPIKKIDRSEALEVLKNRFGSDFVVSLIRKDERFLVEFCHLISNHNVLRKENII